MALAFSSFFLEYRQSLPFDIFLFPLPFHLVLAFYVALIFYCKFYSYLFIMISFFTLHNQQISHPTLLYGIWQIPPPQSQNATLCRPRIWGFKKRVQEEKQSNLLLIVSRNQNSNVVSGTKHTTPAEVERVRKMSIADLQWP